MNFRHRLLQSNSTVANLLDRLIPDLDRNDKFMVANSVYRLAYFTYHQSQVLFLTLGPLTILPPVLEARAGVNTATGLLVASLLVFLTTWLLSKYFEKQLLKVIKSKFKDKPHIKRANVRLNVGLMVVAVAIFTFLAFGINGDPLLRAATSTETLLHSGADYGGVGGLLQSTGATLVYAALVFIGLSCFLRAVAVGYYDWRL